MAMWSGEWSEPLALVKENRVAGAPLPARALLVAAAAAALALVAVARLDGRLPEVRARSRSPPDVFIGEIAYEHLLNLTGIGPRVAGSYENEVAAVAWALAAMRSVAAVADAHHHRLELDLHTASGAFPLRFLDGMTNAYRGVQSVVARLSARGARPGRGRRAALLLNCHFDTVPDSPGASDDGAGCAVLAEVARALAASPRLLRHDAIFLFNGAEENILQASHGFVTRHPWARDARAFVNIEACGAGGREVLFQAGPHHPWIVEAYAEHAPHPFASSLAQEIFESGLIPGDTDFRIFRDFGNLSGVDLAWSANGYVYHTSLDDASRVPPASLQRAGDNVLALATALLQSERLAGGADWERDSAAPQPVFFDVLGAVVVRARGPLAAAVALLALALAALALHLDSRAAALSLYLRPRQYWALVGRCCARAACASLCGLLASGASAGALSALGATMAWYSRPSLLAPLYALPALGATTWVTVALGARERHAALLRGWWACRAALAGALACWALLAATCWALRVRSGFVPVLWTLGSAGGALVAHALSLRGGRAVAAVLCGQAVPFLQTAYLALGSLQMFVPIMGRAGASLPSELVMSVLVSALALGACGWLPALALATRRARCVAAGAVGAGAACALLVACSPLGFPYSAERPQRVMLFETRRTLHYAAEGAASPLPRAYWMPDLDARSPASLRPHVAAVAAGRPMGADECRDMLYCGAPYYLPVASFISRAHWLPASAPAAAAAPEEEEPAVRLSARVSRSAHGPLQRLHFNVTGPGHVVLLVAPAEGARLVACSLLRGAPVEGPRWGARRTYFFFLHAARGSEPWLLHADVARDGPGPAPAHWADVSLAGHALFGPRKMSREGRALLAAFPPWTAPTGWAVDLHLYRL